MAATPIRCSGCPTDGLGCRRTQSPPRSTGSAKASASASTGFGRSILPSRSAMSPTTRRTPSPAGPGRGCRRRRNGSTPPPRRTPMAATSSTKPARSARAPATAGCSATSGNGPEAPISPIPASAPPRARSASITASSCARRWCSGAAAAPPRAATFAPATATSTIPISGGCSPAFGWRVTPDPAFRADVLAGLAAPVPAVPARWLYDRRGSELFEQITRLAEYYPTRTETAMLERHSADFARLSAKGAAVVEFGSGSSAKTPILLRAIRPAAYVPIDISGDFLRESADAVAAFRHRAIWNDPLSRIEMHLEAVCEVSFTVAGQPFSFAQGATIHTENSHKYGHRDSRLMLRAAGWGVIEEWVDEKEWFSLLLAEAEPPRFAP